jgi:hypothetical protein
MVAQIYNCSYTGGRDKRIKVQPVPGKNIRSHLKKSSYKVKRAVGVATELASYS